MFKGRDDFEVVVELGAFAADDVRGRRLHSRQEVTEIPGGMLRVRLRLDSLADGSRVQAECGERRARRARR